MRRSVVPSLVLVLVSSWCAPAEAGYGYDPDYLLALPDRVGLLGETAEVAVRMPSNASVVEGWHFGVCHDDLVGLADGAVADGADLAGLLFSLHVIEYWTGGWTVEALLDATAGDSLPPDSGAELYVATYSLDALGTAALEFCETLGDPEVTIRLIAGGAEIEPETRGGFIDVLDELPPYYFSMEEVTVAYDPENLPEDLTVSVDMNIEENPENSGFPHDTQGFSMGVAHDGDVLDAVDLDVIGILATVNNGGGPMFCGANLNPNMGQDDGFTWG